MSAVDGDYFIIEKENVSDSVASVTEQYSTFSSSVVQDSHSKDINKSQQYEVHSAILETPGYEHKQNVYNSGILKRSPQLANGQVMQKEEYSDAVHDQSWFRVHSDVFKDKFYWNYYEKTDLTYSKLSPYYKMEISPGVPVMPNLSRRALHRSSVGAAFMPRQTYHHSSSDVSSSSSTRRNSSMNLQNTYTVQRTRGNGFDGYSDDESDFISRRRTVNVHEQQSFSFITKVYTFIATLCSSIYTRISNASSLLLNRRNVVYGDVYGGNSTPPARQQTDASSVRWGQGLYTLLCHHLLADSWLLQSLRFWARTSDQGVGRHSSRSRLMFLLFFLLPLAALAGWWAVGTYPTYPMLSSKPAELMQTLRQFGNQHIFKEEISLPVTSNGGNSEKEYLDMKTLVASLAGQFEALKDQVMKQHVEMEKQQDQLQLMEKIVGRLDDANLELSKQNYSYVESALHDVKMMLQSVTSKVHRLSRCCDRPPLIPAALIHDHVLNLLRKIFNDGGTNDYADIHAWMKSMFIAKDELETRLTNVTASIQSNVGEEVVHSAKIIMDTVAERIIQSKLDQHQTAFENTASNTFVDVENYGLSYAQVKQIVQEALSVYDADKTGLVDYALESSGGSILSTRCTENFNTQSATLYMFNFRWIPWFPVGTSPRVAIQPNMSPGECWAFAGAQGFLVIQLSREIFVSGFTLEHIPKSLSPYGHIDSAPKKFSVWGLENENDEDSLLLGSYMYMHNSSSLQYFKVQQEEPRPYRIVELKVISNHGHPNYTCIYRFRVHGTPVQK